jgi:ribosome biogenesis GTPase
LGKKKKTRVQFRKNRNHVGPQPDLTRKVRSEGVDSTELPSSERVSGKGDLSRYRTIIGVEEGADGSWQRAVDESLTLAGRVTANRGTSFLVRTDDHRNFDCGVRRVVNTLAREQRNAVVVGDRVRLTQSGPFEGVIERVEPRHGTLSRKTRRGDHLLVANVDQVLIVVAAADPQFKPNLIDRYLISAELGGVRPVICINKVDLVDPVRLQPFVGLYSQLGYEMLLVSVTQEKGIARLQRMLRDRETVVTGQSGVGKSSLLNAVQPGMKLATGEVSEETRKGCHTTSNATLLELDFGGWVVDTPGVRQFQLSNIEPAEACGFFREFRPYLSRCKFSSCSHTHEAGCQVKQAVDRDLIALTRYESYLKILNSDMD